MLIEIQNHASGVFSLKMNNDLKRNALTVELLGELAGALRQLESEAARTVILRANSGVKVWSAGHSLDELEEGGHDPLGWQDPLRRIIRDIERFPAPIVAMIEGSVWGGACELAFACDLIIATPETTFAATPAKIGVPYNSSGLQTFLNVAHLRIAKEMLFTAQPISALRLAQYGVINQIVAAEELEAACVQMGQTIANNAPLAVAAMKEQLRMLSEAQVMSPTDFERLQFLRRLAYGSADYTEGVHAIKEHRVPHFHGA